MSTEALRSRILRGTVRHRRGRFTTYDFTHHVWYLAVDIDELPDLGRLSPLLAYERRALLEVRDADHVTEGGLGIEASVRAHLERQGLAPSDLRVTLVAYPRVLGYVFNPVSFYLCRDVHGQLVHVIAEVHNTHGDREVYDFSRRDDGVVFRSEAAKRMYVSPFIDLDARYELSVAEQGTRVILAIREHEGEQRTLYARLDVREQALTARGLLAALVRDPMVAVKTVALIGWHAVRLRIRGVRWQRYGRLNARVPDSTTAGTAGERGA